MIDLCSNRGSNMATTQSLDLFVQPTQIHSKRLSKPLLHFGQQLIFSNINVIHALTMISFEWSFNFLNRAADGGSWCSKSPPWILRYTKQELPKFIHFFSVVGVLSTLRTLCGFWGPLSNPHSGRHRGSNRAMRFQYVSIEVPTRCPHNPYRHHFVHPYNLDNLVHLDY